jgi:hypothetical protein
MVALALVLEILGWVLLAFFLTLVARFVLSLIVMFAPQWHPKGPLLLLFELVYSVTDPFLRPHPAPDRGRRDPDRPVHADVVRARLAGDVDQQHRDPVAVNAPAVAGRTAAWRLSDRREG